MTPESSSRVDDLTKLAEMLKAGLLTRDEFDRAKRDVLGP